MHKEQITQITKLKNQNNKFQITNNKQGLGAKFGLPKHIQEHYGPKGIEDKIDERELAPGDAPLDELYPKSIEDG